MQSSQGLRPDSGILACLSTASVCMVEPHHTKTAAASACTCLPAAHPLCYMPVRCGPITACARMAQVCGTGRASSSLM